MNTNDSITLAKINYRNNFNNNQNNFIKKIFQIKFPQIKNNVERLFWNV